MEAHLSRTVEHNVYARWVCIAYIKFLHSYSAQTFLINFWRTTPPTEKGRSLNLSRTISCLSTFHVVVYERKQCFCFHSLNLFNDDGDGDDKEGKKLFSSNFVSVLLLARFVEVTIAKLEWISSRTIFICLSILISSSFLWMCERSFHHTPLVTWINQKKGRNLHNLIIIN